MENKRSYLDNINEGRRRRPEPDTSLDEISKTLDRLESRLGRAIERGAPKSDENEITRRIEKLSQSVSRPHERPDSQAGRWAEPAVRPSSSRASLERAAFELERARRQEHEVSSIGGIAAELKILREELRDAMRAGMNDEFEMLRRELASILAEVPNSALNGELVMEFERLSDAIAQLADRSDDKNVKMLRLEMEELKSSIASLAREETLRAVDRRWDTFDTRWTAFEDRLSSDMRAPDPALDLLHQRIEEIGQAVNRLPESLSLRSLEERVRSLASALDQLVNRKTANPELYAAIDERLDEISRAIVASTPKSPVANFDPQPFERIEARISSLANQVAEVLADRSGEQAVDHLSQQMSSLSLRVDEIANRIDIPDQMVERLAHQIAGIAQKLDTVPAPQAADVVLRGMEDRFAHLSRLIEQRQGDALEQGRNLVHDLEQRLQEITARIDQRADAMQAGDGIMATIDARFNELAARLQASIGEPAEAGTLRALEMRLDDISGRLQTTAQQASSIDPDVLHNLEAQVRSLSEHLARPTAEVPEFEDITPRLENIERSLRENRTAVLDAARQAAEQAIGAFAKTASDAPDQGLRDELKALEVLTRKSDERNTKTFEAIHDTLLKIVDRLGTVESTAKATSAPQMRAGKIAVEAAPSIEPGDDSGMLADDGADDVQQNRSPAEAAAAAARAALDEDNEEAQAKGARTSLLGGLSRALTSRRDRHVVADERDEPEVALSTEAVEIDAERINEPLEPGTGAPDLNAIMRRVRDEKKAPVRESNDAAKSDFIAAARRAAQAAAAEAEILKKRQSDTAETAGRFGIGKIFKRARKPLALTLGAGLLVVGGLEASKIYLAETTAIPPQQSSQTIVSAPKLAQVVPEDVPAAAPQTNRPVRVVDNDPVSDAAVDTLAAIPDARDEIVTGGISKDDAPLAQTLPGASDEPAASATPEALSSEIVIDDIPLDAGPLPLREAAAAGEVKAVYEIGSRYAEGRGTSADPEKAMTWYMKAAETGFAPAQFRIGDLYQKGSGVERDAAKAKMWFQLAAQQGNASAMHNLGVLYAMGADGPADNESAARWFIKAAEHGVKDSQFNLGILTAKGMGMPQDLVEAYKWFALVARTGDKDALGKRDEIAATLGPDQLKQAQDKTELWKAKPVNPEANLVDIPESWRESGEVTASIDMKKAITNIQLILNQQGFDAGAADGVMGQKTKTAIAAFQKANGMQPTGEVDEVLVRALLERNKSAKAAD
ncbi:peptidoglycan-binding protein [Nitratireductor pacificus]|uniref:Peptidoglycan-binding domain 1 protein n=1 Tax=Nitratireductor pacificus pht-3B TaxID=391937 RepID=K2LQT1_9HYPH|nr:peptidoglycan-binding protein [Nitratireductor pacificus]EKF20094.1 peptidoglycan-binding domain 1 protein [Nitratireductor pacificus pht-3B]